MEPTLGLSFLLFYFVSFSDASCPDGSIRHGNTCYHLSHDEETWTGAKVMCEAMKMQLVEIETSEEGHFLGQQSLVNGKNYWIALADVIEEDKWVWMNSLAHATYTNFNSGEPNGHQGENCVVIATNTRWIDVDCRKAYNYICEKDDAVEVIGRR